MNISPFFLQHLSNRYRWTVFFGEKKKDPVYYIIISKWPINFGYSFLPSTGNTAHKTLICTERNALQVIRFFWSKIISLPFPAWASALFKTSKNKSKFQRKLGAALYDKRLSRHITTSESRFCGCAFWIFIYSFGGIDNRQPSDSFNFLNHNLS